MLTPEQIAKSGTEHAHQSALFAWANQNVNQFPQLKWLYATPNGFFSTSGQKAKMKAEGLRDGVPDVCLPWPIVTGLVRVHGLYIEMKVERYRNAKDGGLKPEQIEYRDYLKSAGYQWHVAYTWEEARDFILEYLK